MFFCNPVPEGAVQVVTARAAVDVDPTKTLVKPSISNPPDATRAPTCRKQILSVSLFPIPASKIGPMDCGAGFTVTPLGPMRDQANPRIDVSPRFTTPAGDVPLQVAFPTWANIG